MDKNEIPRWTHWTADGSIVASDGGTGMVVSFLASKSQVVTNVD